ncbi:MAG: hypothetical protein J2P15_18835, partial [Micromonosporaceae bacterium]|nr:hypothetical protein [Micromonosporaceae bacterium]
MSEPAVVVRHCTVEVLRRGGWSWGPAPDRLPGQALDALARLLTERFAEQLAGDRDVEITEPVRLEVRVPLAGLRAGAGTGTGRAGASSATAAWPDLALPGPDAGWPADAVPAGGTGRVSGTAPPELAQLLAGHPDLERLLRLLPEQTRRAYRAVLARLPASGEPGTGPDAAAAEDRAPSGPHGTVTTQPAGE